MTTRITLLLLPIALAAALGVATCQPGSLVKQETLTSPGYAEPHTPGSGVVGVEMAASPDAQSIVGADPDLNRVSILRTYADQPEPSAPRAILILVPGFLGGAGTFAPLARQLVTDFNGNLEVWAVDRRPNQLEDRRGSQFGKEAIAAATSDEEVIQAIEQAIFFYLPEDGSVDINGNGEVDPPTELPDALGASRSYVQLAQDDLRFAAYWGVDTYLRDWKLLVDEARARVGPQGLVLFGGHSQGTYWASVFAAYDFDPDPAVVDAAHAHIDGLVLLEGGGGRGPSPTAPNLAGYESTVSSLAQPGGPDVFLSSFQGIQPALLGPAAELAGLAGIFRPLDRSLLQLTSVFTTFPFTVLFGAPTTNRGIVALFVDDDFQPIGAFRASVGFTSDATNGLVAPNPPLFTDFFYIASPHDEVDELRQWQDFDDPTLPTCPPNTVNVSPGCAILDNGAIDRPRTCIGGSNAGAACSSSAGCGGGICPLTWGLESEVTSLDDLLQVQIFDSNFIEWYFLSGRPGLDGQYGLDSSALVAESVTEHGDEGPLVITQNASMDVPVLCIGGSNGLAPLESSFAGYLSSIATPPADQQIAILEGYAHLDVLTARDNAAVPVLTDWINRLIVRKLLGE
jgi:pimeloyl-ACP methyl ester carboxylesterase